MSPNLPMSSLIGMLDGKMSLLWIVCVALGLLLYAMLFLLTICCEFEKGVCLLYLIFLLCCF